MQNLAPLLLAVAGGSFLAVQAPLNALLARHLGHPVLAAIVSFAAGLVALVGLAWSLGLRPPAAAELRIVPTYLWVIGGCLGVAYMVTVVSLVPRLGSASVVSLTIAGQMLTALAIDQYGLLGVASRAATQGRLLGALLLIAGVWLITRR